MKLKFKVQLYQTNAVESVVDCFAGQVNTSGIAYRIDPGVTKRQHQDLMSGQQRLINDPEQTGFKNADLQLTDTQLLTNTIISQPIEVTLFTDSLSRDILTRMFVLSFLSDVAFVFVSSNIKNLLQCHEQ
ncbi:MAG: hypothetical protein JW795_07100 [Chitinivibrionales bacterium]|nr:hypothetical protein [Chitinivibrionales bacterium]